MTTANRQRCTHCKSPYIYHPSFYGEEERFHPYNHHEYCPDCFKAVKQTLDSIPIKWEKRWLPSTQYTMEEIVAHQETRCNSGKGLPFRRIFPTLIDMTGQTRHNVVCEGMPDGEWYMAEWWSHMPECVKISKETWVEL